MTFLFFCNACIDEINVFKGILWWFTIGSGLKIYYNKCERLRVWLLEDNISMFAVEFGCQAGSFPSKYFGMPL